MDGAVVAQWCATGVIAVALIVSWVRNGKNQSEEWGSLQTEVKNIQKQLDDPNQGLGAIKKSVDEQKTHCASITSEFEQRIAATERRGRKKQSSGGE